MFHRYPNVKLWNIFEIKLLVKLSLSIYQACTITLKYLLLEACFVVSNLMYIETPLLDY